jgi:hypothetical protein
MEKQSNLAYSVVVQKQCSKFETMFQLKSQCKKTKIELKITVVCVIIITASPLPIAAFNWLTAASPAGIDSRTGKVEVNPYLGLRAGRLVW